MPVEVPLVPSRPSLELILDELDLFPGITVSDLPGLRP